MRTTLHTAELHIRSAMSSSFLICAGATFLVGFLYLVRILFAEIPPQDHAGLALLISVLLFATWVALEQLHVRLSLVENRCWVKRHWMGTTLQTSIPVSQIHSAKTETSPYGPPSKRNARIVLVTSLGMIPLGEDYIHDPNRTERVCETINRFLQRQDQFLAA